MSKGNFHEGKRTGELCHGVLRQAPYVNSKEDLEELVNTLSNSYTLEHKSAVRNKEPERLIGREGNRNRQKDGHILRRSNISKGHENYEWREEQRYGEGKYQRDDHKSGRYGRPIQPGKQNNRGNVVGDRESKN
ncbi:hypothetical protein J6590_075511 [Homalodisca vitripennis]|nr:hypothetical protein J6590_075511 [Homalodisca vitripennis]